jgi:pimeloyl-ACP methyl ester carboxylesterase
LFLILIKARMSPIPQSLFFACPDTQPFHKIHVLKWAAEVTTPLPPVICVHGLTRHAYDFVDVAQRLCATRDVYSFSMAGRGESDWLADPMLYTYPHYVNDCLHIICHELKLGVVDWVGTSMGGLIGMMIAATPQQTLIRKLVLNDIGPFLPLLAIKRIAFYASRIMHFQTIEDAERHCRVIYADFGIKGDAAWRFFAEKTVRPAKDGGFTLHYDAGIAKVFANVDADVDVWPMFDAIACPTLLLRGAHSDILSKETAQAMTQRGPKAQLVTFDHCGHAPALQDDGQISMIEGFLS